MRFKITTLLLLGLVLVSCEFWPEPVDIADIQFTQRLQLLLDDTVRVELEYAIEGSVQSTGPEMVTVLNQEDSAFTLVGAGIGVAQVNLTGNAGKLDVAQSYHVEVFSGVPITVFVDEDNILDLDDWFSFDILSAIDSLSISSSQAEAVGIDFDENLARLRFTGLEPGESEVAVTAIDSTGATLASVIFLIDVVIRKMVLVEDFTNADCINCPTAAEIIDTLIHDYPASLRVVRYHLMWPDPIEPMYLYNPQDAVARWNAYGNFVNLPTVFIDGVDVGQTFDEGIWAAAVQERLDTPGELLIREVDFGLTTDSLIFDFSVTPYGIAAADEFNVFTVLTEDSVEHDGEYEDLHLQVMRDMATSSGVSLSEPHSFRHALLLPPSYASRPELFNLVVFVQHTTTRDVAQTFHRNGFE